jgi:protein-tyrosine phosphatase
VIDLHTHLLPGVDDGAATEEIALGTMRRFREDGVRLVACTPHLRASRVRSMAPDALTDRLTAFQRALPAGIAAVRGWEIMLDEPGVDLTASHLSLGGSRAVLVEFPRGSVPVQATREVTRISMSGVVPVLAHPERYHGCTPESVRSWRSAGAVMQVDAMMLLGTGRGAQVARTLLAEGLVDLLASDNHGDARALAPVREWLEAQGAPEHASLLTQANAERLLRNEALVPVPPLRLPASPLARLRAWVSARVVPPVS